MQWVQEGLCLEYRIVTVELLGVSVPTDYSKWAVAETIAQEAKMIKNSNF